MSEDKKKKKVDLSSKKAIEKEFGKVISNGIEFVSKKNDLKILKVSPALDLALNGGLLEGTWNIISGDPKAGKSSICLSICRNALCEKRPVIYIDCESRLKDYNVNGIEGLDKDKIQIVHTPEDGSQLAAEDFLKIAEAMIKMPENNGAVCVIDSCSSLVPRNELEEDPSATIRGSLPKLLSHWIKKNAQSVVKNKIIVLIITHYITNTSGYGKTKIPDCGVMVQYQADTRIDIVKVEPWEEDGKKIGQMSTLKINCSALGSSGTECVSYIRYKKGVDSSKEIIELATSLSVIDKAGAWYSLEFLEGTPGFDKAPQFQGQTKLYNFLEERRDIFNIIVDKVKDLLA